MEIEIKKELPDGSAIAEVTMNRRETLQCLKSAIHTGLTEGILDFAKIRHLSDITDQQMEAIQERVVIDALEKMTKKVK